jgi:hypothetical protein
MVIFSSADKKILRNQKTKKEETVHCRKGIGVGVEPKSNYMRP